LQILLNNKKTVALQVKVFADCIYLEETFAGHSLSLLKLWVLEKSSVARLSLFACKSLTKLVKIPI